MEQAKELFEAELLPPEEVPEDVAVDLAPLTFSTPLEMFKNLFDRMADIRKKVILWESKTVITSPKTRDAAIELRTTVTRTAKAIEDAYLSLSEPARTYLKELRALATEAQVALIGTKDDPSKGVGGRLTKKISDYAAECKRIEEELKAKALAEQKALEEKLAAEEREREAQEARRREEEEQALALLERQAYEKAEAEAKASGSDVTDLVDADLAVEQERARIDAERAQREKEAADKRIADEKALDEQQRKTVNTMAVATAKGKVKGVKEIWAIELVDESLLDKQFMSFDVAKARKWLEGGFYNKKETDAEKIIPGLRCVIVLGKGGR